LFCFKTRLIDGMTLAPDKAEVRKMAIAFFTAAGFALALLAAFVTLAALVAGLRWRLNRP